MSVVNRQKRFFTFFDIQAHQNRVSHAYLLVGKNDTYDTALEMAKRIFCDKHGCGVCTVCQRIDANEFGDLRILSGKESSIKKDEILDLKSEMSQTALESRSKRVYILEDCDHASVHAMNSLLKFLEEPTSDIVAILTTENLNRVIDTIQSRCLIVHLAPEQRQILKTRLIERGFANEEACYLSSIARSEEEATDIGESQMFHGVLDAFRSVVTLYEKRHVEEAGIRLQVACKELKMDLQAIQWLCAFHDVYYRDIKNRDIRFLPMVKAALTIKDRAQSGVIASMLMDQFAYELIKESQ